jgi:hypothetical protein
MAQVVSRRPLAMESNVRSRISPRQALVVDKVAFRQGLSEYFCFLLSIIAPSPSILIYHVRYEQ